MTHVIPTGTTRDSEFLFRRMEQLTFAATRSAPGARVLDSAAGLGQDSRALARGGARAVCAEPSHRMIGWRSSPPEPPSELPGQLARAWSVAAVPHGSLDAAAKGALDHFDDRSAASPSSRVTRADGGSCQSRTSSRSAAGCSGSGAAG